ncbi:hypothetical protein T492DRAFT_560845, partial [Pavlovales sp. CCMP2436]
PSPYLLSLTRFETVTNSRAGHFIAEHYVFTPEQKSYSYYGPLHLLSFNVSHHNDHHDFPYVAWSKLPELRQIALEFYEPLSEHRSWSRVIYDFV